MSDFATPDSKQSLSRHHLSYLKKHGMNPWHGLILKREKDAYLYDIDENKYCDFALHNGSVLIGHNDHKLTQYVKNGLSVGSSPGYYNKFYYRLLRLLGEFCNFSLAYFFSSIEEAFFRLIHVYQPEYLAVNTEWLRNYVRVLMPFLPVKIAEKSKTYSMLLVEPLDFDGSFSRTDVSDYDAKFRVGVDIRTAFRVEKGFSFQLGKEIDAILAGPSLTNGLNTGLILSQKSLPLSQTSLPAFQTVAMLETIKYYRRNLFNYAYPELEKVLPDVLQQGSMFKIQKEINIEFLQKHAIVMRESVGFLCRAHSGHDIRRLKKALFFC